MVTACFAGPRPGKLYGYERWPYKDLQKQLTVCARIYHVVEHVDTFISGGAQGVDQLGFWTVEHLKEDYRNIRNVVYVPFKGQEKKWAESGAFGQRDYKKMLELADEVKIITDLNPEKDNVIPAMFMRNRKMIEDSDIVIGVWPESKNDISNEKGGTVDALKFTLIKDKQLVIIDPETYKIWNGDTLIV